MTSPRGQLDLDILDKEIELDTSKDFGAENTFEQEIKSGTEEKLGLL